MSDGLNMSKLATPVKVKVSIVKVAYRDADVPNQASQVEKHVGKASEEFRRHKAELVQQIPYPYNSLFLSAAWRQKSTVCGTGWFGCLHVSEKMAPRKQALATPGATT